MPYEIAGHTLMADSSVGISLAPDDGSDADALIRNADLALSRAKSEGRGIYRFFEPEMDARTQARRKIELALKNALARDEFNCSISPSTTSRPTRLRRLKRCCADTTPNGG